MPLSQSPGLYFDGVQPKRQHVAVDMDTTRQVLEIYAEDGSLIAEWPLQDLRQVKDISGFGMTLFLKSDPDAVRLTMDRPGDVEALRLVAPKLNSSDLNGRIWTKIVVWSGGAIAAMALMIFVIVPALAGSLAPLIPPEREAAIGQTALRQIENLTTGLSDGTWFCDDPAGQAALDKMTAAVTSGQDIPYDLQVRTVNDPMFNAFALPGGQIILMRGLIDRAETADQVAGVLAHEVGHVFYRDPIEQALRATGSAGLLSLVLGDATGGTLIAVAGESLLNASYTRKAEERADVYALERMKAANISPEAFAGFFDILLHEHDDLPELPAWANTHPASDARAEAARQAVDPDQTYAQILTDAEWAAVKNMCKSGS